MTIKQALKLKNKLIKSIVDNTNLMLKYNTIEVGNQRPYSSSELYNIISANMLELAELKTKIHIANTPVLGKIFAMSEMKSLISNLKKMDCTEGKSNRDRYRMESELVLTSEISLVERDSMVNLLETQIETIQDELDTFNATTTI